MATTCVTAAAAIEGIDVETRGGFTHQHVALGGGRGEAVNHLLQLLPLPHVAVQVGSGSGTVVGDGKDSSEPPRISRPPAPASRPGCVAARSASGGQRHLPRVPLWSFAPVDRRGGGVAANER